MRNWNRVGEGFDILRPPLVKFVALELSAAYGKDWWDAGVDPVLTDVERAEFVGCASNPGWLFDCLNVEICLRVIDCSWSKLFSAALPRRCYPWVLELEIACDDLAREDEVDCSDDDANRWLDTMQRLCGAVDDDPAEERAGKILALMDVDEASGAGGAPDEAAPSNTAPAEQEGAEAERASKCEPAVEEGLPQTEDDSPADQAESVEQAGGVKNESETPGTKGDVTLTVYASNPVLGRNCRAVYHHPSGRMDVLAGSYVRIAETDSLRENIHGLRAELAASGDLVARDDQLYVLNKQVSLGSPSAAAQFVLGAASSGPRSWRDVQSGSTIGELFPRQGSAGAKGDVTLTVYASNPVLGRNCKAVYHHPSGRMDVLAGSYVRIAETDSLRENIHGLRAELAASGDLVARDDQLYVLNKQVSLGSPSAAAEFVLGASSSGPRSWRDVQSGVTLGELFPNKSSGSRSKKAKKSSAKKSSAKPSTGMAKKTTTKSSAKTASSTKTAVNAGGNQERAAQV